MRLAGGHFFSASAMLIREVPEIDQAVVSTDHEAIARAAVEAGIAAPFRRLRLFAATISETLMC